ncbi:hypothetical protein [Alkalimarinus alittae]|uniref:Uncharacterized protein n=1 Tax=Alkalimarinus alittae TaxID=2961619 RepID=A0ABY6N4E0_9ALTE|nr:hypothetical protein [Alkalimarinus alittae]UZE96870.1 hypothetical protein NKI27_03725 [Alkalimarinus alittae]
MKADATLNFDFVPYWTIPYRFFLTAPLFAVLAGIVLSLLGIQLLLSEDIALWQSRWIKDVIFTLHLITIGTITMVMVGALFQITSVVGGRLLPGGRLVAAVVYGCLASGGGLFFIAMLNGVAEWYAAAACLLVLGLLVLVVCGLIAIARAQRYSPTLMSMRLSLLSLLIMISVGAALLLMHGYPESVGFDRRWTDFHLLWALAGWIGLLIMGVSFQVIPMFHVTPSFNVTFQRWMPVVTFLSLITASVVEFFYSGAWGTSIIMGVLLGCFGIYAAYVWVLLSKRKRKIEDITVLFWKTAAISLAVFSILHFVFKFDVWGKGDQTWLLSGVLLVFGVIVSVIVGMLQKIIPFLSYLHMQRFCAGDFEAIKSLPHMRAILKIKHSRYFYRLHLSSLALLLLMIVIPEITLLAGLSVSIEFSLLFFMTARVAVMVWKAERNCLPASAA